MTTKDVWENSSISLEAEEQLYGKFVEDFLKWFLILQGLSEIDACLSLGFVVNLP